MFTSTFTTKLAEKKEYYQHAIDSGERVLKVVFTSPDIYTRVSEVAEYRDFDIEREYYLLLDENAFLKSFYIVPHLEEDIDNLCRHDGFLPQFAFYLKGDIEAILKMIKIKNEKVKEISEEAYALAMKFSQKNENSTKDELFQGTPLKEEVPSLAFDTHKENSEKGETSSILDEDELVEILTEDEYPTSIGELSTEELSIEEGLLFPIPKKLPTKNSEQEELYDSLFGDNLTEEESGKDKNSTSSILEAITQKLAKLSEGINEELSIDFNQTTDGRFLKTECVLYSGKRSQDNNNEREKNNYRSYFHSKGKESHVVMQELETFLDECIEGDRVLEVIEKGGLVFTRLPSLGLRFALEGEYGRMDDKKFEQIIEEAYEYRTKYSLALENKITEKEIEIQDLKGEMSLLKHEKDFIQGKKTEHKVFIGLLLLVLFMMGYFAYFISNDIKTNPSLDSNAWSYVEKLRGASHNMDRNNDVRKQNTIGSRLKNTKKQELNAGGELPEYTKGQ